MTEHTIPDFTRLALSPSESTVDALAVHALAVADEKLRAALDTAHAAYMAAATLAVAALCGPEVAARQDAWAVEVNDAGVPVAVHVRTDVALGAGFINPPAAAPAGAPTESGEVVTPAEPTAEVTT